MTTFYKNYVQQCANKNVSLSAAAEAVGLSRTSPNGWKKGKQPSDVTLQKLSDYFGCSIEDLTKEKEPGAENDTELDETTKELIDLAYSLNDDDRALLLEMARSIRKRRADYK